jgi:hypothetical protein
MPFDTEVAEDALDAFPSEYTNVLIAHMLLSNHGPSKTGISSFRLDHGAFTHIRSI